MVLKVQLDILSFCTRLELVFSVYSNIVDVTPLIFLSNIFYFSLFLYTFSVRIVISIFFKLFNISWTCKANHLCEGILLIFALFQFWHKNCKRLHGSSVLKFPFSKLNSLSVFSEVFSWPFPQARILGSGPIPISSSQPLPIFQQVLSIVFLEFSSTPPRVHSHQYGPSHAPFSPSHCSNHNWFFCSQEEKGIRNICKIFVRNSFFVFVLFFTKTFSTQP